MDEKEQKKKKKKSGTLFNGFKTRQQQLDAMEMGYTSPAENRSPLRSK